MIWLGIDCSNEPLSVALVNETSLVAEYTAALPIAHSIGAMPAIEALLHRTGLVPKEIEAVAVASGPGSYTGVRIGMTLAKTLAWTLQAPLHTASSLAVLAANAPFAPGLVCPLIDARRQHVFTGLYKDGVCVLADAHRSLEELYAQIALRPERDVLFIGHADGFSLEAAASRLPDKQLRRADGALEMPRASQVVRLARQTPAIDVHPAVPSYLRMTEAEANLQLTTGGEASLDGRS